MNGSVTDDDVITQHCCSCRGLRECLHVVMIYRQTRDVCDTRPVNVVSYQTPSDQACDGVSPCRNDPPTDTGVCDTLHVNGVPYDLRPESR